MCSVSCNLSQSVSIFSMLKPIFELFNGHQLCSNSVSMWNYFTSYATQSKVIVLCFLYSVVAVSLWFYEKWNCAKIRLLFSHFQRHVDLILQNVHCPFLPKLKNHSSWNKQNCHFWDSRFARIDFMQYQSGRKMLKFPHSGVYWKSRPIKILLLTEESKAIVWRRK